MSEIGVVADQLSGGGPNSFSRSRLPTRQDCVSLSLSLRVDAVSGNRLLIVSGFLFSHRSVGSNHFRSRSRIQNDMPKSTSVWLIQPPASCAGAGPLVLRPCLSDFRMRTAFENVHPTFKLQSLDRFRGVVITPKLRKNGFRPNPNLFAMILLLLR